MAQASNYSEANLFRHSWDDGLIDVLAGAALLVAGIGWAAGVGPLALIQAPLWTVLWAPLHARLVAPRAGHVRFSEARRERSGSLLLQAIALGAGALGFVVALRYGPAAMGATLDPSALVAGLPAAIVATMACLTGLLLGARRFFAYAVVLLAAGAGTVLLGADPGPGLAVAGGVILAIGAWLLARFLRQHPATD